MLSERGKQMSNAIEKVKNLAIKAAPVYTALVVLGIPQVALADAITSSSFSGVLSAITAQISVSTVAEVLTYAAGIAVALVFFWWGVRKALRVLMGAFRRGRMSV